jgi:hypothetical protein
MLGYWINRMTTTRQNPSLSVLIVIAFLLGCAQSPSRESGLSCIVCPETGRAQAFAAVQQAVKSMYFVIDEADLQTGYIKTLPLSGAQGFELWRSDSVGMFNAIEASLQSIRRTAELKITAHDKDIHINCVVTTQRLNMPGRQASSSSQAYRIHSDSSRAIQRLKLSPEQERNMVWIDLGHDQRLAQRILDRIRRRLSDAQIPVDSQT